MPTSRLQKPQADVASKDRRAGSQRRRDRRAECEHIKKLELALRYLKIDHRVARFTAVDQTKDEATGEIRSLIEFVELNDEGHPIDTPRQFSIRGDIVYIDGWVVKFDDKYVEQADLERGTSLLLFKRIFGSGQKPDDGYPLDEVGSAPQRLCPRRQDERLRAEDLGRLLEHRQRSRRGPSSSASAPLTAVRPS